MKRIYRFSSVINVVFSVPEFAQNNNVMATEIMQNLDEDKNAIDEVTPGEDNSTDDTTPEDGATDDDD